ncbi:MAG: recombinase RecT [Synergistaceae bacterium]|nr:recombinase RecT [Synergistaceae bacterium]
MEEKAEKAIAIKEPEDVWTKDQINTIKNTVAVGANDSELKMFLNIAAKYELDPFLREIWFANMGSRNTIMTGRDGYLKIANRDPNFDGMKSDVVHAGDKFIKDGDDVKHAYNMINRGPIVGAYAIVFRKDRKHPTYCFAPYNEYNKGVNVWRQYPSAMIVKVAETMALKRAFSISGLVTEEEIGDGEIVKTSTEQKDAELKRKEAIRGLWNEFVKTCGDDARLIMGEITGKNSSSEYTDEDIATLAIRLDEIKAQQSSENSDNTPIDVEEVENEETNNAEG